MYLRIMNKLDVQILDEQLKIDSDIKNRISELVGIMDENYGANRGKADMGGYVLLFTDEAEYQRYKDLIMSYYNIDAELYEYSDDLGNGWFEDLYLMSSEDALVMVYQKGCDDNV